MIDERYDERGVRGRVLSSLEQCMSWLGAVLDPILLFGCYRITRGEADPGRGCKRVAKHVGSDERALMVFDKRTGQEMGSVHSPAFEHAFDDTPGLEDAVMVSAQQV